MEENTSSNRLALLLYSSVGCTDSCILFLFFRMQSRTFICTGRVEFHTSYLWQSIPNLYDKGAQANMRSKDVHALNHGTIYSAHSIIIQKREWRSKHPSAIYVCIASFNSWSPYLQCIACSSSFAGVQHPLHIHYNFDYPR